MALDEEGLTTVVLTAEDVRALNRVAAYLDGVLALSYNDTRQYAKDLFRIAGNPVPEHEAV